MDVDVVRMGYRERCFECHGRECWVCGAEETRESEEERPRIEVHHIRGRLEGHGIENLMPLCRGCHGKVHSERPREGEIGKVQAVWWRYSGLMPEATERVDFVFREGRLEFRVE